jgi:hypothetical protein
MMAVMRVLLGTMSHIRDITPIVVIRKSDLRRADKSKRDSSLRDPAHKERAQEKAGSLRSE